MHAAASSCSVDRWMNKSVKLHCDGKINISVCAFEARLARLFALELGSYRIFKFLHCALGFGDGNVTFLHKGRARVITLCVRLSNYFTANTGRWSHSG